MSKVSKKKSLSPTVQQPAARWAFVLVLCAALGIVASYYWRVFYGLDARGLAPLAVTGFCVGLAVLAGAAALLLRRVRDFAKRGAACILLCGILFAFANPPLQTPDETDHYLRTYAISMGRFDFDAARGYPMDVDELVAAFPGAWVNAHTSAGVGTDPDTHAEQAYNTAGYALKQYGKDGRVESIWDSFTQYLNWESRDSAADFVTEPISFLILPFLPGALGMALARLLGFGALGCLYGGRLVNLLAYAAMCYAALRTAHKCRPAFLCIMLMPMSLYMGASLSYDATLLGCYYLMLALLTQEKWNDKTALCYALACVFANGTKPYINLLWVVLPFVVRRSEWKVRFSRAVYAVLTAAGALALTFGVEQYGTLLRHNYGAIARQGGAAVNGGAQLLFVLKNPLRYIAVLLGTLYENDGFIGQLGLFGWKDMPVAFISLTAPLVLLLAAMLCTPAADALGRRRTGWLGVFGLVYAVGAMTAMYITYTPVAMVRIVGLQTRYFLPVWLLVVVAAAALARRALAPHLTAEKAAALAVPLCGWYAFAGAVLLFQHYFVGPVYTIYK
jgi:membrane protein